ncbi:MAG: DUF4906 domain-containing protein [Bacteroidales bacterium]|nr:DUF4906 domain-containing protein [Bacteroidales bacterium]
MKAYSLLPLLLLVSCTLSEPESAFGGRTGSREVVIQISSDSLPAASTRSSVTASDSALRIVDILFYENSRLCSDLTVHRDLGWTGSYSQSVSLVLGRTYDVLVIANASGISAPQTLQEAVSGLQYTAYGISGWNTYGIPMSGQVRVTVTPYLSEIEIQLTRLVAKVKLSIHTSGLEHGTIDFTSIRVRQMNGSCPFFDEGRAASSGGTIDGDLASDSELSGINANRNGYTSTFYLLENLQGDILPGNNNPDMKTPESVLAAGGNPDTCSYIEILGRYSDTSGNLTGTPLTARLFLGDDPCSNFDIRRNMQYDIDLTITDEGCLRTDWKIDGNLDDRRKLQFTASGSTVAPSSSATALLSTNLRLSDGDYSYSLSGDLGCFSVSEAWSGRLFTITATDSAPSGASLQITASSWDGRLVTVHTVTVERPSGSSYSIEVENGGTMYVAQRRTVTIKDKSTGNYPSGTVQLSSANGNVYPWKSGQVWYLGAWSAGEDELMLKINGTTVATETVLVIAPELQYPSDRIFLPLDGAEVDCGPYYYEADGTRLDWSDFDPDLYSELLDVSVVRYQDLSMRGSRWSNSGNGGSPAVTEKSVSDDCTAMSYYISRLSLSGVSISENYDFESGDITLERITAYPASDECGVDPVSAVLYTSEPFLGSRHFGSRSSWALARWPAQSEHDEKFTFSLYNLVRQGNDYRNASAVYPFSSENKYSFSFPRSNTVEMTVLYADNVESAMPERYFSFAPVMQNRHSGDEYVSSYRWSVDFTVNLAVGAVAEENGAGGCAIKAEWVFPRCDDGLLDYIEDNVVASNWGRSYYVKGMYSTLYTIYGYSSDMIREQETPDYVFADLRYAPGSIVPIYSDSYQVPESYAVGYDLVLWKYSALYPDTGGWVVK